jgi:hypothetical protein
MGSGTYQSVTCASDEGDIAWASFARTRKEA